MKVDLKQKERKIVYDNSLKGGVGVVKPKNVLDKSNNKLMKGYSGQINENIDNIPTFDSNDSDDDNDNNQKLCFSMLCTDDDDDYDHESDENSSDEENAKSNNRPAPPEWSLTMNRKLNVTNQTEIEHRIIDTFFGSEYESVDMLEIFPLTNPRRAKRRKSSMKWDTPVQVLYVPHAKT